MAPVLLALLTAAALPAHARLRAVAFPLANTDSVGTQFTDWACCVVAESFSRGARYVPDLQVLDPVYVWGMDTSAWRLDVDSVVASHHDRWKWDVALGGEYGFVGDTLWVQLKVVRASGGALARRSFRVSGVSVLDICEQLATDVFTALGEPRVAGMLTERIRAATRSETGYRTYASGCRFELLGQHWAAVSAYRSALDLDAELVHAALRLGRLYALARDHERATEWMLYGAEKAGSDPVVAGIAGAYLVEHAARKQAAEFVTAHQDLLSRSAEGLHALGLYHLSRGEYQRAVAYLSRAVALGPADLEADLALGQAHMSSGDFAQAADVFNRLVSIRPDYPRFYVFLGTAYRRMGYLMESVRVLTTARLLGQGDPGVMVALAHTSIELGNFDEARRLLEEAHRVEPTMHQALTSLAVVYWQQGERGKARGLLREVQREGRGKQALYNNLAGILMAEGQYRDALEELLKAQRNGRANTRVLHNLGMVSEKAGRLREAMVWYGELLQLDPGRLDVLVAQARVSRLLQNYAEAESAYRGILQVAPRNEGAVRGLAGVLVEQGRPKEAVEFLERYLNDMPGERTVRMDLADIYVSLEWYQVAEMHYAQVVRDMPDRYESLIGLGTARYGMLERAGKGDVDSVVAVLRKAQTVGPQRAEPDYLLALVYLDHKNEPAVALEHARRALEHATDADLRRKVREVAERAGQ